MSTNDHRPPRPLRVGLTGNIGSGKSSVARALQARGAAVIDADELAREATRDPRVLERIAQELGSEVVARSADGDAYLDRRRTAAVVFDDPRALARLNAIVHPWVRARSAELEQELTRAAQPPPVIVLDIPLLYENGLEAGLDAVVVVTAPLATRIERVVARAATRAGAGAGVVSDEAEAVAADTARRDAAQLPLAHKAARADYVIDNSGDLTALETAVARLWDELLAQGRATA